MSIFLRKCIWFQQTLYLKIANKDHLMPKPDKYKEFCPFSGSPHYDFEMISWQKLALKNDYL